MKVTQVIKNFLNAKTLPDLASLYNEGMEVQVMVDTHKGEPEEHNYKGTSYTAYRCGTDLFKNIRIPRKAKTANPEYDLNTKLNWPLDKYVKAIGMTGWDWKNQVSKYFMFDFDSIVGHSVNHEARLSATQLDEVRSAAEAVPWITIRKSTAGHGIHFYVFVEDIPTESHTEHAALARAILGKMSAMTGFNFGAKLDVCGGVGWVWAKKYEQSNGEGFKLLKEGRMLEDIEIPDNWRDHVDVVSGKRNKTRNRAAEDYNSEDALNELTASRNSIELDEGHKKLFKYLDEIGARWYWEKEENRLCCHTNDLKKAYESLEMKGTFETISTGSSEVNCFAFPLRKGAWVVRRFSPGVAEHKSWHQDGSGWTRCFLNQEPDFRTACRSRGGKEIPDRQAFEFKQAREALEAAQLLGEFLELDAQFQHQPATLRREKSGRLVVEVKYSPEYSISDQMQETWRKDLKKGLVTYIGEKKVVESPKTNDTVAYDHLVRHVVSEGGEDAGWIVNVGGVWTFEPLTHVKMAIKAQGYSAKDAELALGSGIFSRWELVNLPFKDEYPGNRQWNRDAAKLTYNPDLTKEELFYPTWKKILAHCGQGLNEAVAKDDWCKRSGIRDGADYLFAWLHFMFKEPDQPLPYLFFYGKQNVGKSAFHESASLLFNKGYGRAENALLSKSNFNGELKGLVLAVVEEIDFTESKQSINRLKDWVTSPKISIHEKNAQPYMSPNYLHFVQVSNNADACPIDGEDSRVVMCRVKELSKENLIPKKELLVRLQKEAQDFITALFKAEYGESEDRLRIPVVNTREKIISQQVHLCPLEAFFENFTEESSGSLLPFMEFKDAFRNTLDDDERRFWSDKRIGNKLPPHISKGRSTSGGGTCFANIYWKGKIDSTRKEGFWVLNAGGFLKLKK